MLDLDGHSLPALHSAPLEKSGLSNTEAGMTDQWGSLCRLEHLRKLLPCVFWPKKPPVSSSRGEITLVSSKMVHVSVLH